MLGWAIYALFIVLATWWVASLRTLPETPRGPAARAPDSGAAAVWVRVAGILAVLLGLKSALMVAAFGRDYQELLWAAAAIAIASGAGATMAVWRRREGWAFSAALGTNLAASLVVWYFHRNGRQFRRLVAATGRGQRHRLLGRGVGVAGGPTTALPTPRVDGKRGQSPFAGTARRVLRTNGDCPLFPRTNGDAKARLLATQIVLPVVGMIAVLALPVVSLVEQPAAFAGLAGRHGRRTRLARAAAEHRGRRVVSWPGLAGQS